MGGEYKPYKIIKYIIAVCYCCGKSSDEDGDKKSFSQTEIEDAIGARGWQVDKTTRVLICPDCVNDYSGKDFLQLVKSHKM